MTTAAAADPDAATLLQQWATPRLLHFGWFSSTKNRLGYELQHVVVSNRSIWMQMFLTQRQGQGKTDAFDTYQHSIRPERWNSWSVIINVIAVLLNSVFAFVLVSYLDLLHELANFLNRHLLEFQHFGLLHKLLLHVGQLALKLL